MDRKSVVKQIVKGNSADYVPSGFWHHFAQDQANGEKAVTAHIDFLKSTGVDLLKIMNENLYQLDSPVRKASDWGRIKPAKLSCGFFERELDLVKRVLEKVGDDAYTLITIHGAFASAFHTYCVSDDDFARRNPLETHISEDPEAVARGLKTIAESLVNFALACLECGVDAIYYAALGGESYRTFAGEGFLEVVKPADMFFLEEIRKRKADIFVHVCKDRVDLRQYKDYPGDVFNWAVYDDDFSLTQGWELFKKPILGGLDDRSGVMLDGNEKEIAREVRKIRAEMAQKPFILGCDCTLPCDVDYSRIRAAIRAANDSPER